MSAGGWVLIIAGVAGVVGVLLYLDYMKDKRWISDDDYDDTDDQFDGFDLTRCEFVRVITGASQWDTTMVVMRDVEGEETSIAEWEFDDLFVRVLSNPATSETVRDHWMKAKKALRAVNMERSLAT